MNGLLSAAERERHSSLNAQIIGSRGRHASPQVFRLYQAESNPTVTRNSIPGPTVIANPVQRGLWDSNCLSAFHRQEPEHPFLLGGL